MSKNKKKPILNKHRSAFSSTRDGFNSLATRRTKTKREKLNQIDRQNKQNNYLDY